MSGLIDTSLVGLLGKDWNGQLVGYFHLFIMATATEFDTATKEVCHGNATGKNAIKSLRLDLTMIYYSDNRYTDGRSR